MTRPVTINAHQRDVLYEAAANEIYGFGELSPGKLLELRPLLDATAYLFDQIGWDEQAGRCSYEIPEPARLTPLIAAIQAGRRDDLEGVASTLKHVRAAKTPLDAVMGRYSGDLKREDWLAEATGLSVADVLAWRAGDVEPELVHIERAAEFYGCSVAFLLGRSDVDGEPWFEESRRWLDEDLDVLNAVDALGVSL
jgi:hypothetical protein